MLLSSLPALKKSDADFADMAKEIRETFDMYDLDGNGSIDEAELVEGLGEAGGKRAPSVKQLCPVLVVEAGALYLRAYRVFMSRSLRSLDVVGRTVLLWAALPELFPFNNPFISSH